jgi:hypothetical protein
MYRGKFYIYLRSVKCRFADGRWELIGLELASVNVQCDHTPCDKALRAFSRFYLSKCRNTRIYPWTFQRFRSADDRTVQILSGFPESGFREF